KVDVMPEIPEHPSDLSANTVFTPPAWEGQRAGAPERPALPLPGPGWFARQLPQCVFICDASGRCLLANGPLLAWLGRAEADVVGRSIFELWPAAPAEAEELSPDPAVREAGDLQLILEGGRIEQVETRTGARGPRAVRAVKFPWAGASGRIEGMVVVF